MKLNQIAMEELNDKEVIRGNDRLKRGFAHMLKGGVIMDVTTPEQAMIAETAGAVAVMVLDKLPADIRTARGVARTASLAKIEEIMDNVSIPVMAKCRIGHVEEALALQALGVDMVDESEVLTPADETVHIWKHDFVVPFVNGSRDLGEALRRIEEGSAMIRTKGEAGTGNVAEAVRHVRMLMRELRILHALKDDSQELLIKSREMRVSFDLTRETAILGRLPVVNFAAGGIATPADAALMMRMGMDGVFVGSGIFKSKDPQERAEAIVLAVSRWEDDEIVMEAQKMIDETKSMFGLDIHSLNESEKLQYRGAQA